MSEDVALIGGNHTEIRQIDASQLVKLADSLGHRKSAPKGRSQTGSGRIAAEQVASIASKLSEALSPPGVRAGSKAVFVVSSDNDTTVQAITEVMKFLPGLIKARRQLRIKEEVAKLVDLVMPRDASDELARDIELENAMLRQQFLQTWPSLRSREVHKLSGRTSGNAALTASRWKRQQKVFAVPFGGHDRYPAFQFRDGQPRPIIGRILAQLGGKLSPWQTAFWFVAENGWLDGKRPVDRLDADPEAVVEAAGREVAETLT